MDWCSDVHVCWGASVPKIYLGGSKMNGITFIIRVAFFSFLDPLFFLGTLSRSLGGGGRFYLFNSPRKRPFLSFPIIRRVFPSLRRSGHIGRLQRLVFANCFLGIYGIPIMLDLPSFPILFFGFAYDVFIICRLFFSLSPPWHLPVLVYFRIIFF